MVTPAQKRDAVEHLQSHVLVGRDQPLSQRRAGAIVGASRRSVRRVLVRGSKDEPLQDEIEALAHKHPRYGYRRVHALMQRERIANDKEQINIQRVHRL